MAKLYLKKTSKRVSCRTKYKVEHKVREHNRKKRRAAKKDPFHKGKGAHKKLIPVPNNCPFKADILAEAAAEKQRKVEEREKRRLEAGVERLAAEAEAKQRLHDNMTVEEEDPVERKMTGGQLKAYYREFKKVVEASDVVLEVLDARDPLGTRCLQVERAVLDAPGSKRLVIVLNKSDLVDRENLDAWLKHLRQSFPTTAFKASTQGQKSRLGRRKFMPNENVKGSSCVGANLLMSLLANYCRNKGIKTAITVGVVGMPNVGKSSLINSLKRGRACGVGATPGVTKSMQVVQLDSKIQLLDSPGIVMSSTPSSSSLALRNVVDIASLQNPSEAAAAILARASKQQLMEMYDVPDYSSAEQFLASVAKRYGRQKKGGVPDQNTAARILVGDWNRGKIRYHTSPPADASDVHVSAEIVAQMADEFRLDDVATMEAGVLRQLATQGDRAGESVLLPAMEVEAQPGDGVLAESVSVTGSERGKKVRWRKDVKTGDKPDKEMRLPGNLKQNKAKKLEQKKLKKEKARTSRRTDNLADTLDSITLAPSSDGDAYDFSAMS